MATTYSTSLKLTLIGDGLESGTWGQTTNTNLGTLLEQAITGYVSIDMADANVTLTSLNGTVDQARNAVIELTGTNNAVRDVIPPVVEKLYTIFNNTTGGYAVRVIGSTGTGVTIPNGVTAIVYCNGTNFVSGLSGVPNNFYVAGAITATANVSANNAVITNNVSTTNLSTTNVTATTANITSSTITNFVSGNVTITGGSAIGLTTANATSGTITNLTSSNVTITGGSINGVTGTNSGMTVGNATNATNATDATNASFSTTQAAGTSNTTIATTAFVQAAAFGSSSQSWQDVSGSRSFNSNYTNSTGKAISVAVTATFGTGAYLTGIVGGVTVISTYSHANTEGGNITFIVPAGATYSVSNGGGVSSVNWAELR